MSEGPEFPESPQKLVLPENVSISAFYTVILGEMDPKVAKLVNLAQNWTFMPLIRPIIHQRVMLEGPESPKSVHKLVLPENLSISAFYTIILGEMDPKEAKVVNLAKNVYFSTSKMCHISKICYTRVMKMPLKSFYGNNL